MTKPLKKESQKLFFKQIEINVLRMQSFNDRPLINKFKKNLKVKLFTMDIKSIQLSQIMFWLLKENKMSHFCREQTKPHIQNTLVTTFGFYKY